MLLSDLIKPTTASCASWHGIRKPRGCCLCSQRACISVLNKRAPPLQATLATLPSPNARAFEPGTPLADALQACGGGIQLLPIHRAGAPAASVVFRAQGATWMVGCAEDSQRAVFRQPCVSPSKVDRILIPSLSAENVLGIPGMLCTISSGRQQGHERSDFPVHLYGPAGLLDLINTMLTVSRTYLEMPVLVHELVTENSEPHLPILVNSRSRLYLSSLCADRFNANGYHDGRLTTILQRAGGSRKTSKRDSRSGCLPLELPPPGDPEAAPPASVSSLQWTILATPELAIVVRPTGGDPGCLTLLIQEAARSGQLDVEKARALGLMGGPAYGKLKQGRSVWIGDGKAITPDQVLGPSYRGRRIVVLDLAEVGIASGNGNATLPLPALGSPEHEPPLHSLCDVLVAIVGKASCNEHLAERIVNAALAAQALEIILWPRAAEAQRFFHGDSCIELLKKVSEQLAASGAPMPPMTLAGTHDIYDIARPFLVTSSGP